MKWFIITSFTLICILNTYAISGRKETRIINSEEQEALEKARRNTECCKKKMRCCSPKPPNIEIRAILARCPNTNGESSVMTRKMKQPVLPDNEHRIKSFQGFDEDEPLIQSELTKCKRKVLLTIKVRNSGIINCKNQYIVVDHVYDPISERSVRLLNPYVVKLKQNPVSKSFALNFLDYVNSEAREQVYNKHDSNFTGCYVDRSRPTCGVVKYEGQIIPYSQGFCCSCDARKNLMRQPDSVNDKNEAIISYSDPAYLLDGVQCPRNYINRQNCSHNKRQMTSNASNLSKIGTTATKTRTQIDNVAPTKRWTYTTYSGLKTARGSRSIDALQNNDVDQSSLVTKRDGLEAFNKHDSPAVSKELEYFKSVKNAERRHNTDVYIDDVRKAHNLYFSRKNHGLVEDEEEENDEASEKLSRKIRQVNPSGVQKRGGQNCADRFTPSNMDPDTYHESAHCLRFSDVWFGVYKLHELQIEQSIFINIYERFETEQGAAKWREVTNSNTSIQVGNRIPHYMDEKGMLSITLTSKHTKDGSDYSDLEARRMLIPEGIRTCDAYKYPEMQNGPEEYLVVRPEQISAEGNQCDRIGVGFEAFAKQPKRCGVVRGTCLRNQPKHLWRHDHLLEKKKKKGCYFLKYYANITRTPILVNQTTGEKFLFVDYTGHHLSTIDIEINADFNAVIRQQPSAVITEIYIDSTCGKVTILIIKVINSGLVSAQFMVQLADFPLELSDEFSFIKSRLVLIAPQNQHKFTLEIRTPLPSDLMYCTVEVLNANNELIALRRVRIQKFDRCICTWYCLCACVASYSGLKCAPMSLEHYHAAGFQGALPIVTYIVHYTLLDDIVSIVFYFSLFILGTLLVLGLTKAILGLLCCAPVGIWGLHIILDLPKRMKRYYEPSLRKHDVKYDNLGWPIHPDTGVRVRNISRSTEFCTNVVFFFTYPFACCIIILKRLCCPYYVRKCGTCATEDGKGKKKPVEKKDKKEKPVKKDKAEKPGIRIKPSKGKTDKPAKKPKVDKMSGGSTPIKKGKKEAKPTEKKVVTKKPPPKKKPTSSETSVCQADLEMFALPHLRYKKKYSSDDGSSSPTTQKSSKSTGATTSSAKPRSKKNYQIELCVPDKKAMLFPSKASDTGKYSSTDTDTTRAKSKSRRYSKSGKTTDSTNVILLSNSSSKRTETTYIESSKKTKHSVPKTSDTSVTDKSRSKSLKDKDRPTSKNKSGTDKRIDSSDATHKGIRKYSCSSPTTKSKSKSSVSFTSEDTTGCYTSDPSSRSSKRTNRASRIHESPSKKAKSM